MAANKSFEKCGKIKILVNDSKKNKIKFTKILRADYIRAVPATILFRVFCLFVLSLKFKFQ